MKRVLMIIFFVSPLIVRSQATTKVSNNLDYGRKEIFYVLKDNKSIKHGSYQMKNSDYVITEGFYKNGLMDSSWTYRTSDGRTKSRGMYKNGERVGVWEFCDHIGAVEHKYDYSLNEVVFLSDSIYQKTTEVITDNGSVKVKIERAPLYLEGSCAIMELLDLNLNYPRDAVEKGIQGKVWISFKVDKTGVATDFKVESGIGGGCDEEALRVVRMLTGPWIPALLNGEPVSVIFRYPISFSMM